MVKKPFPPAPDICGRTTLSTARVAIDASIAFPPSKSMRSPALARTATSLLATWGLPEPVRLLGVGVTNLVSADAAQLPLFDEGRERRERLNQALDEIADRFGGEAVSRGEPGSARRAALSGQIKRGSRDDDA